MLSEAELNQFYRYCYALTRNEASAYDLLHDALEKYLTNTQTITAKKAYIQTIIRNRFIDNLRASQRREYQCFDDNQNYIDFDIQTLESLIINEDMIEQVLAMLSPMEREILYFWAIEGFSTAEVAKIMEMPKGTVLSKIHRMRIAIKQRFGIDNDNKTARQL
jgi:RNA polymerase sigma-70 factor (ECF subfamily)